MKGFTRKLVLEERVSTSDGAGGSADVWTPIAEHWASVRPRNARESSVAGRQVARVGHKAEIRYFAFGHAARPKPDQRFREGARIFAITGVSEADDRRERLVCWLEEGTAS